MKLARSSLALLLWLGTASAGVVFFACASEGSAENALSEPDAQTLPGSDAGVDTGCTTPSCVPLACADVDFCPVDFPVSRLVALNSVWGNSANDVWAVGSGGTILHGDGAAFTPVSTGSSGSTDIYLSVWGTSSTDIWILGPAYPLHATGLQNGTLTLEPRPGSSWNAALAETGRLWSGLVAGGNVWIAGEESGRFGTPRRSFWTLGSDADGGVAWSGVPACTADQPCLPAVRALWAADADTLWAVGANGQAYGFDAKSTTDGGAPRWLAQNGNTRNDLEALWGSGANDVWAVGQYGTIRHASKGSAAWSVTDSPTTEHLHAVWGSSANDVWAVGENGAIIHFDGQAWTSSSLLLPGGDVPTNLLGVWGTGPDDVWIVGEGIILHRTSANRRHS